MLGSAQPKGTEEIEKAAQQFLDHCALHPDAEMHCHASEGSLHSHADESCLSEFEARNQEWQGIVAVGLVTLNRVADSRFPDTPCEVVYQGPTSRWWYEKHGKIVPIKHRCQFSWFCDGKSDVVPKHDQELWHSILTLSGEMIGAYNWGSLNDITQGSTHYHADYVYPEWRREKTKTITVGNHIFYRWEKR